MYQLILSYLIVRKQMLVGENLLFRPDGTEIFLKLPLKFNFG
jgi:hypothetical protein